MRPWRAGITLLVLGMGLCVVVLGARAHKALQVEEVPPPAPKPLSIPPSHEEVMRIVRELKGPFVPSPPLALTVSKAEAQAEILRQIREVCLLLKPDKLSPREVAEQLGTHIEDDEMLVRFQPRSPYFDLGDVDYDELGEEADARVIIDAVDLRLRDPRLLTLPPLLAHLGPEHPERFMETGGIPYFLRWSQQPKKGLRCEFVATTEDGSAYGEKEPVVRHVLIEVWRDDE